MSLEQITLGGGCFWCIEAAFENLRGVLATESGYAGGHMPNPDYRSVCTGETGHAEVVQVTFDDAQIDLATLLEVFFTVHDPTTLNRQGNDVGTQYRSVIFYHDEAQHKIAQAVIQRLQAEGLWEGDWVTELAPLPEFYPAEDYHQKYYLKNSEQPYCRVVIEPKLQKLRARHRKLIKP